MDKTTYQIRLDHWSSLIQDWMNSGLNKRQWCLKNSIDEKQFYYWQRKIRQKACELHSVNEVSLSDQTTSFVELPVKDLSPTFSKKDDTAAVIRFRHTNIEISDSASDEFLKRLLGALTYVQ